VTAQPSQILPRLLLPQIGKVAMREQQTLAHLACGAAGLAAERFRLANARWPNSLEEIAEAGFLKQVPTDLYDARPLRLRRAADGLVIYSVGPDRNYDGRALDDSRGLSRPVRIEFRLWDPSRRRQPPRVGQLEVERENLGGAECQEGCSARQSAS